MTRAVAGLTIPVIRTSDADARAALQKIRALLSPSGDVVSPEGRKRTIAVFGEPLTPIQVVQRICRDVKKHGFKAVVEYTAKLDGVRLTPKNVRVSEADLKAAHESVEPEFLRAVRRIRRNIERFHAGVLPTSATLHDRDRCTLQLRYIPLRRVGICVPGGAASYPSTILMTAVPALVAGVQELAVVSPPTPNGADSPYVRATCYELGIRELYRIGGAQAVAALAYGVTGIPAVDKIVGPGNIFVALAKREVFGQVDIDMLAGPTEVVVLADRTARPAYVASELISQAEHAPGCSILITWHDKLVDKVLKEIERQLASLERAELARQSLQEFGALIVAKNADEAIDLINDLAPEHLYILTRDPHATLDRVRNAGAVFLGPYSPVASGDYAAGPSHVLPTGGTARFNSCLTSIDFLKRSSVIELQPNGLLDLAPDIEVLARVEGLTAHAASVRIRVEDIEAAQATETSQT